MELPTGTMMSTLMVLSIKRIMEGALTMSGVCFYGWSNYVLPLAACAPVDIYTLSKNLSIVEAVTSICSRPTDGVIYPWQAPAWTPKTDCFSFLLQV